MNIYKNKYISGLLIVVLVTTVGCAGNPYGPRQTTGGLAGAALGGLLGTQFGSRGSDTRLATTIAGVMIGGLIGSEIGRSMDDVDRMKANQAVNRAQTAPLGEKISWNNPQNNHSGSFTPVRDGYSESGNYCREFYQTVSIAGKNEDAYGVACRQPDGTWRIVQN